MCSLTAILNSCPGTTSLIGWGWSAAIFPQGLYCNFSYYYLSAGDDGGVLSGVFLHCAVWRLPRVGTSFQMARQVEWLKNS